MSYLHFETRPTYARSETFNVPYDVKETKDDFVLTFDVPGLAKDDINIEVADRKLTISGERKNEDEFEGDQFYRLERSYGEFSRRFDLPEGIDTANVQAAYENGVLKVIVPKGEVSKARKIKIGDNSKSFLKKLTGQKDQSPEVVNA